MLVPELCDRLSYEEKPRIGLEALIDLLRLIDSQCVVDTGRAESASGGQDAEQQEGSHRAAQAAVRRRGDLDRTPGADPGTLPRTVAPTAGKRPQGRRREFQ